MDARSIVPTLVVLVAGLSALALGTDGGRVWTAETARRQAVIDLALPNYDLRDTQTQTLTLSKPNRELTVVDFIYTNCPTVCLAMGAQFRTLQSELASAGLLDRVQLLSITFDPTHDDLSQLNSYLTKFSAMEPHWRAARFDHNEELQQTLKALGVIVIPEPTVGFVHNAAFYLIEAGQVVEIFDVDHRTALLAAIEDRLTS